MEVMEAMLDFLSLCPPLAELDQRLDFSEESLGWTLYDCGGQLEQVYWDGVRLRSQNYSLELRAYCGDAAQRLENLNTMEVIRSWLLDQNQPQLLPDLPEGKVAQSLDCSSGAMGQMEEDGLTAGYHLQLCLHFEERGSQLGA